MIRLTWNLSQKIAPILRAWLPTNVLRDAIRTRRGLKWGLPCMLLAAPLLLRRRHLPGAHRGRRAGLAPPLGHPVHLEHVQDALDRTRQLHQVDPLAPPGTGGLQARTRTDEGWFVSHSCLRGS